jgi:DNA-J related protein/DnaJ domain
LRVGALIPYLSRKIKKILVSSPQGISEYELISRLQKEPENEISEINLQNSLELFQVHFMVSHCLYLLRDNWLADEQYCLQISPLKISLLPYSKSMTEELAERDPLRDYYLDLSHLENTDADAAENLINSFWHKFVAAADRVEALAVLGLDDGVSFEQVKSRYRQLAMGNHPDRGGCQHTFSNISQAMDVLRSYYQTNKANIS